MRRRQFEGSQEGRQQCDVESGGVGEDSQVFEIYFGEFQALTSVPNQDGECLESGESGKLLCAIRGEIASKKFAQATTTICSAVDPDDEENR